MASESELRDMLAGSAMSDGSQHPHSIDATTVIKRSRARRLPRQIATGAIGGLAVLGITVIGVQALRLPDQSTITAIEQESADSAPEGAFGGDSAADGTERAPADRLNLCEGTVAEIVPSQSGLQLDVEFPATVPSGSAAITGIVRLTNTGTERVTGSTAPTPAMTISQDGIVLWHTNGPMIRSLAIVDLAPGESLEYQASIVPVRCTVADDLAEGFPEGLPALTPGAYELSAAIDFSPQSPEAGVDLVSGPRTPITLE